MTSPCPLKVGITVKFSQVERPKGFYQNIEHFSLTPGRIHMIKEIKNELYLYFEEGVNDQVHGAI